MIIHVPLGILFISIDMKSEHHYQATIQWTGNKGTGTDHYKNYERDHHIAIEGKPILLGSSDPAFRGDPIKHNPEDLFLSSLASCHMLWYLHFCSTHQIIVVEYWDNATGIMQEETSGKGYFTAVTLHPKVIVTNTSMVEQALALHQKANEYCFIANSVNFPIHHKPEIIVQRSEN